MAVIEKVLFCQTGVIRKSKANERVVSSEGKKSRHQGE